MPGAVRGRRNAAGVLVASFVLAGSGGCSGVPGPAFDAGGVPDAPDTICPPAETDEDGCTGFYPLGTDLAFPYDYPEGASFCTPGGQVYECSEGKLRPSGTCTVSEGCTVLGETYEVGAEICDPGRGLFRCDSDGAFSQVSTRCDWPTGTFGRACDSVYRPGGASFPFWEGSVVCRAESGVFERCVDGTWNELGPCVTDVGVGVCTAMGKSFPAGLSVCFDGDGLMRCGVDGSFEAVSPHCWIPPAASCDEAAERTVALPFGRALFFGLCGGEARAFYTELQARRTVSFSLEAGDLGWDAAVTYRRRGDTECGQAIASEATVELAPGHYDFVVRAPFSGLEGRVELRLEGE